MITLQQMTPSQLAAGVGAQVLDVREPHEVAGGVIAGSVNVPLPHLRQRLGELDPAVPVVTVCRSGRRSRRAAEVLQAAGYTVANLEGGIERWTLEGHPLS